jgi:hypothetical protein
LRGRQSRWHGHRHPPANRKRTPHRPGPGQTRATQSSKRDQESLAAARAQPAVPPKSGLWCAPMFLNMVSATVAPGACGEQLCPPPNSHPRATVKGASLLQKGALAFSDIWQHTLFLHAHQRWGGHPHNLICGESSDFLLSVGAQSWGDCLTRCREIRPTKPFHNVLIS